MSNNDFQLASRARGKRRGCDEVDEDNIITEKHQRVASAKVREATLMSSNVLVPSANCFEILSDQEDGSGNSEFDDGESDDDKSEVSNILYQVLSNSFIFIIFRLKNCHA